MTPLEQRILQARNHQLVARIMRDRTLEAAATKMLDVCLDYWARQHAAFPRGHSRESAN